jgi:gluconokinase
MEHILVMGIAGAGKTTLGRALALRLAALFVDGDDHHSEDARAKMAAGVALSDQDRAPWLVALASMLKDSPDRVVLACSALTPAYRAVLGVGLCVYLEILADLARTRLSQRQDHFAGPALLPTQIATLVPPTADEGFALLVVPAHLPLAAQIDLVCDWLAARTEGSETTNL